jgi:hypothetical protein
LSEKEQRWGQGKEVIVQVPLKDFAAATVNKHDNSKINEYSNK